MNKPDSDEIAMLISLFGHLKNTGIVSDETLEAAIEEMKIYATTNSAEPGGILEAFSLRFKDGTEIKKTG